MTRPVWPYRTATRRGRAPAPPQLARTGQRRRQGEPNRTPKRADQQRTGVGPSGPRTGSDGTPCSRRELPEATAYFCREGKLPTGARARLHTGLRQPEDEHRVAERIADLEVPARRHGYELLAVHFDHRRRSVDSGAAVELPQHRARLGIVRLEPAVTLAGEHQAAGGGGRAAHHRQLGLRGPGDLAGVQVDRVDIAVLTRVAALVVWHAHEGAAEPQTALLPRGVVDFVMHRLVQPHRVRVPELRVHRDGRPLLAAVR